MYKTDSFIRILWDLNVPNNWEFSDSNEIILDLKDKNFGDLSDIDPMMPVIITFLGLDSFMDFYIPEVGNDLIDKKSIDFIIDYINDEIDIKNAFKRINWQCPTSGSFIMVYNIIGYTDYDGSHEMDVICKGVIGKQVKLIY